MKDYILPICITVFNCLFLGLVAWVVRIKAKSDKAEMKEVVEAEIKPIVDKMEMTEDRVRNLETKNEVDDLRFDNLLEAIVRNNDLSKDIKRMIEKHDTQNRASFISIFKILEKKQDK